MSDRYLIALTVVVALILASRYLFSFLPLTRWAAPLSVADTVTFGVGVGGLALHCGAMFFRSQFRAVPGGPELIRLVDPLGNASILWFSIAAALVLLGLRSQHYLVLAVVLLSLAAVGVTMYDGGRLNTHLSAIFAAVVVLAGILATLVIPPWRHGSPLRRSPARHLPVG